MAPMSLPASTYRFFTDLARVLNAGQSRSVLLYGNVNDLFFASCNGEPGDYVPLINFLCEKCAVPGKIILVYELNGPIRAYAPGDREKLKHRLGGLEVGDGCGASRLAESGRSQASSVPAKAWKPSSTRT